MDLKATVEKYSRINIKSKKECTMKKERKERKEAGTITYRILMANSECKEKESVRFKKEQ